MRFKVNVLNKKGKEVWKYTSDLDAAFDMRENAKKQGLSSKIFVRSKTPKWVSNEVYYQFE